MPWKSVGLSVRGKLLSSISLITRGKFSPGTTCTIIEVDHATHARNLSIEPWRKVWNNLSDIWDKVVIRGQITSVHKSWDRLAMVMASKIDVASRSHVLDMVTYINSESSPLPLQLYFATVDDMALLAADSTSEPGVVLGLDEGVVVCQRLSPCTYEIPENIRDIFVLQDYLNYPTIVLKQSDKDYTILADIQCGKTGEIYFDYTTTLTRYMWATVYREKKNKEMVERFGPDVGYNTVRADEYDTFCDLYFLRFLQITGISNRSLELGLTIMQNWPYTRFRCLVTGITGYTNSMTVTPYPPTALTADMTYVIENDNGLDFQTLQDGSWVDIKAGDVIEAGTPVTAAVRSFDLKNDPDLAKNFPINYLERFHKTVIAFNSDIQYLDDIWGYDNYVGAMVGFTVNDMIIGSTSGAWGYIIQSMHGGLSGKLELRRVVGDFQVGETITDEHGNQATMAVLGDPYYDIDDDATDAYLTRNKRTGSDFLAYVWLQFAPSLTIQSTYNSLNKFSPYSHVETDLSDMFSPSILFKGTALAAMHLPYSKVETNYGKSLDINPEGRIETDYGLLLIALKSQTSQCTLGGTLDYNADDPLHSDYKFIAGQILTGASSGATGVITSYGWGGASGEVVLRHVQGIFENGEVITGETIGDVTTASVLHP